MKFKCQCNPDRVQFQEYQREICVIPPIALKRNDNTGSIRKSVCIDVCLASEILELWKLGIVTTGCCCGHNKNTIEPYIGVEERFIETMKRFGYKVQPNNNDLTREDSFYPKSLTN